MTVEKLGETVEKAGETAIRSGSAASLGLSEQELREGLEHELASAMRVEGNAPTLHAIAHSVARIVADDHLRMVEQLERAGVELDPAD